MTGLECPFNTRHVCYEMENDTYPKQYGSICDSCNQYQEHLAERVLVQCPNCYEMKLIDDWEKLDNGTSYCPTCGTVRILNDTTRYARFNNKNETIW